MDYDNMYIPNNLDQFATTTSAVESIKKSLLNKNFNKFYLFTGDPGLGKSTLAKMMAKIVNCQNASTKKVPCNECENCKLIDENPSDALTIINASNSRGINEIRELFIDVNTPKMIDLKHVYLLDEGEQITSDAAKAMKTDLDEMSDNSIIVMTTNYPNKISKPILERAAVYNFKEMNYADATAIINRINDAEQLNINNKHYNKFIESPSGKNPRLLIKMLEKYSKIGEDVFNIDAIGDVDEEGDLYQCILKPFLYKNLTKADINSIMAKYKAIIAKNTAETVRIMLIRYFHNAVLKIDTYFKTPESKAIFVKKYCRVFELMMPPLDYNNKDADLLYRLIIFRKGL